MQARKRCIDIRKLGGCCGDGRLGVLERELALPDNALKKVSAHAGKRAMSAETVAAKSAASSGAWAR